MPLIVRSFNHGVEAPQPQERVKMEALSSEMEESMVEGDSKEVIQGKWNEDENLKFVIFINYYQDIFSSKHKRKVCKIFKTFQEYLQDRTAAQCRSHYQKMIQKFKTVAKVKKYYENYYGKDLYRSEYETFKSKWEETHPSVPNKDVQIRECKEVSIQTQEPYERPQAECARCAGLLQPVVSPQTESPSTSMLPMSDFNPYVYWNQMGMNYVCLFSPRSEETIDIR